MDSLETLSTRLNVEKDLKYEGTVKVALDSLTFPPDAESLESDVRAKKVKHLQRVFTLEGCDRMNPKHFIPGHIQADVLQLALARSNLTGATLGRKEAPMLYLPPSSFIRCPHGTSQAMALPQSKRCDKWWTIELYVGRAPHRAFRIAS